jgi:hypothetical protein
MLNKEKKSTPMEETTMTLLEEIVRMAEETRGDDFYPLLFNLTALL